MKIKNNFLVISNHNNNVSWVLEYTDNYLVYDRSDKLTDLDSLDKNKVIKSPNIGYNLYDYFTFIIDRYDNLPDVTIFAKGNVFPRHITKEYFDSVVNNTYFTPLEDPNILKASWPASMYSASKGFREINTSWYTKHFQTKYFNEYNSFLKFVYEKPTLPAYIRFAPGANYIVPKENILKLPKMVYENIRTFISHATLPGEASIIERALYTLWTSDNKLSTQILEPINKDLLNKKTKEKAVFGRFCFIISAMINNSIFIKVNKFFHKAVNKIRYVVSEKKYELLSKTQGEISKEQKSEIAEYRKDIKIVDVFTYNGEADVLEIRLNILNNTVDQFIIVEAPTTFSGLKKPLYFQEQKERFAPFLDKIKYFVIEDYPNNKEICQLADSSKSVPKGGAEHWRREFYQKESIKMALTDLKDNDVCFIGDVDEIWNPEKFIDFSSGDVFKLKQDVYTYFLNNKSDEPWAGTIVTKYKNIKNTCLNNLRRKDSTRYTYVKNGGWHFTNMGGVEEIKRKLNDSYTKESYNTDKVALNLEKRFGKSDYLGRSHKYTVDEKDLPKYIIENKIKYKNLLK